MESSQQWRQNVRLLRLMFLGLWLTLTCLAATAVTTSYGGVSVNWEAGLSDLTLEHVDGNNIYYQTKQLHPKGDSLPISITLPADYVQQVAFPTIILWSKAGGQAPYGIVKQVWATSKDPTLPFEPYDLTLTPDANTWVDYAYSGGTYEAFTFMVKAYPDAADFTKSVTFFVHVTLDVSLRSNLAFLLQQLGDKLDNFNTEFEQFACSIGFPTHSVNTSNLNLVVQDTEFSVKTLGPRLSSTKIWNAAPSQKGMFGNGWSFPYESTLTTSCGGAQLSSGAGQVLAYKAELCTSAPLSDPVVATSPQGYFDKLSYHSGDYWRLEKARTHDVWRYERAAASTYRLASITDPNGNQLTITYTSAGLIDRVTDALGRALAFGYNSSGQPVSMLAPGNLQASFAYDSRGNLSQTVDLYGTVIDYTYDQDDYMTAISYAGKTIRFAYDSSGGWHHLASVTDAEGNIRTYVGYPGSPEMSYTDRGSRITDARGAVTSYTKDSAGRTVAIRSPSGHIVGKTYTNGLLTTVVDASSANLYTHYAYDARGNLTRLTDPSGAVTQYSYDASDNLLTRTDALGHSWSNTYDSKHNLITVTSPTGKVSQMAYNAKGQITSTTDANGHVTAYTHDSFGNTSAVTDPMGQVTRFDYGTTGLDMASQTDPNGNVTRFSYDQNRRLLRVTHPDASYRENIYDACALVAVRDENGHTTTLSRDKLLREVAVTSPNGAVTSRQYDGNGNQVAVTDPLGHTSTAGFDPENQMISQGNALGGQVSYQRDERGNPVTLRDELGRLTQIGYDANSRVIWVKDALDRTLSYTRDAKGQLTRAVNARGGAQDIALNPDGQPAARTLDGATSAYSYDSVGNLAAYTDTNGTTSYSYNPRNQVTTISYPDGKAVSFSYSAAGQLAGIVYPGGISLSYQHNSRNQIQRMEWAAHAINFSYDAVGNLLSEARSNGAQSTRQYDTSNRAVAVYHSTTAGVIASYQYSRDTTGNTVAETAVLPVASSVPPSVGAGVFDAANQVMQFNGADHTYDADGNLIAVASPAFAATYDQMNRLASMTVAGVQSVFGYDAAGNRVLARRGAVTTRYYFDQFGKLLFEADEVGTVQNLYLYNDARLVAKVASNADVFFYHHDKNGNSVAMTNAAGAVVNAYAYTPYGELAGSSETVANRFKFVGGYGVMDEGGGIYFMKNRYYHTTLGRFLQKDPIGFSAGQTNLYAYVAGNPIDQIDPTGLIGDDFGADRLADSIRGMSNEEKWNLFKAGAATTALSGLLHMIVAASATAGATTVGGETAAAIGAHAKYMAEAMDRLRNMPFQGIDPASGAGRAYLDHLVETGVMKAGDLVMGVVKYSCRRP